MVRSEIIEEKEELKEDLEDEEEKTPKSQTLEPKKQEKNYLSYKDYTASTKFALLKPHLLSFFHHVYINSNKLYEDFAKFSDNIIKFVEKEMKRLQTLVTYKLDYPEYLLGNILKILNQLIDIFKSEFLLGDEENTSDSNKKFIETMKEFSHALMKALMEDIFDKDQVKYFKNIFF